MARLLTAAFFYGHAASYASVGWWQCGAELFLDRAPLTVSNFICLAEAGFFNGQHFHRCVPTFMVQAGCPYSRDPWSPNAGTGGPAAASLYRLLTSGTIKQRDREGELSLLLKVASLSMSAFALSSIRVCNALLRNPCSGQVS